MKYVELLFEFTDAYQSITDDGSYFDEIIANCQKICDVFEFDFKLERKSLEEHPHLKFSVTVSKHPVFYQDYLNVLTAFCNLYSINLCNGYEFEEPDLL